MGKLLKICGGLFLVALVAVLAMVVLGVVKGPKLDADSKTYVDSTVPILVDEWNPEELKSRANKELLTFLKEPDVTNLYGMFRKLGRMTRYNGSKGQSHMRITPKAGVVTTASYVATADFENGPATIKMSLIKRDESWQILEFRIDSPVLLRP